MVSIIISIAKVTTVIASSFFSLYINQRLQSCLCSTSFHVKLSYLLQAKYTAVRALLLLAKTTAERAADAFSAQWENVSAPPLAYI